MTRKLVSLTAVAMLAGCSTSSQTNQDRLASSSSPAMRLAQGIERSHGADAWWSKDGVVFDIDLTFGGNPALNGTVTFDLHDGGCRINMADGTTLVFDGTTAWISPASADVPMARFHLLTWSYFLAVPFKLRDPGTILEVTGTGAMEGDQLETLRLTFEAGIGDTPDDWYLVYVDAESGGLAALAYIVTYGHTVEDAEAEPHAIVYRNPMTIDGVTLASHWTFYLWTTEQGPHGDPIAEATLRNIHFVTLGPDEFVRPTDSREDSLPPAAG